MHPSWRRTWGVNANARLRAGAEAPDLPPLTRRRSYRVIMRTVLVVSLSAALAVACASGRASGPLRPADPAQAAEGKTLAGHVDAAGVSIVARIGSWRGWPRDLEQRVTPVALTVVNHAARTVRIAPETFSLAVSGGGRYTPMNQLEVSRRISDLAGVRSHRPPIRWPGTPGYDNPSLNPELSPQPRNVPVPAAGDWQGAFEASGTLAPGERLQTVLFFDVPGATVQAATLQVNVVYDSGAKLADVRMAFERGTG